MPQLASNERAGERECEPKVDTLVHQYLVPVFGMHLHIPISLKVVSQVAVSWDSFMLQALGDASIRSSLLHALVPADQSGEGGVHSGFDCRFHLSLVFVFRPPLWRKTSFLIARCLGLRTDSDGRR